MNSRFLDSGDRDRDRGATEEGMVVVGFFSIEKDQKDV